MSPGLAGMRRAAGVGLAGAALILIGLMFDTAPLFVPGVAFAGLGIAMPAWTALAARGARAQRRLHGDRVLEQQRFETTIEVSRGPFGLPGGAVFDPLTGGEVSVRSALSFLSGSRRASVTIVASFSRRGRKRLAPPSVICRDVLGLAEVVRPGDGRGDELLVLPRTEPVKWVPTRNLGAYSQASPGRGSSEPLAAAELDGLRPYQVGTPASRIHWPAVARGAGLLERRMRADGSTRPLVVLDARWTGGTHEPLDAAVRAAGSIALELARRGGCGLLMPGERRAIEIDPDLTGWPVAHTRLALVESPGQKAPLLRTGMRLGRVFYVAAEAPARLPQALAGHAQLPPVLVLPTGVEPRTRGTVVFEVAGCRGYVIGPARQARHARPTPPSAAPAEEPVV